MKRRSALFAVVTIGAVATAISAARGYHLVQIIPIGGPGTPLVQAAVDTAARRLYISHFDQIEVVDVDSGKLVGKVDKTPGVEGIALAPDLGRGFTTNVQAGSSTIFDLKTLGIIGEVKSGAGPNRALYDPATSRVFVTNRRGYSVTAFGAEDGKVVGTIDLDARPEYEVSDGNGHVLVSMWETETILPIDSRNLTAGKPWSVGPCQRPAAMAADEKNKRLFIRCDNQMMAVLDTNNGRLITTVPLNENSPTFGRIRGYVSYDPETHLIFVSNPEGSIIVIRQESTDKYSVVEKLKTELAAMAMTLDLKTHRIFMPLADISGEKPLGNADIRYRPESFRVYVFGM